MDTPSPMLSIEESDPVILKQPCNFRRIQYSNNYCLKSGYIEFARLESSADAIHAAIVSPAVAVAAEVHCQRRPAGAQWLHNAYRRVITVPAIANSI